MDGELGDEEETGCAGDGEWGVIGRGGDMSDDPVSDEAAHAGVSTVLHALARGRDLETHMFQLHNVAPSRWQCLRNPVASS